MTIFSPSSYSKSYYFLIFTFITLNSPFIFSLSLHSLNKNPNFESQISLFGDAKLINGGSSVQLNFPTSSSSGLLMHTKPFKFLDSNRTNPTSFATDFTFSISPHNGDGLVFLIVPTNFPSKFSGKTPFGLSREIRFLGIEFDTSMDGNVGDENANHVGVDVCSLVSARVSNVSDLVLNSGVKLRSWVDYDASSKRLEVRLSKFDSARPYEALLSYQIDLYGMWKEEEVFVALSSSSGNTLQTSSVYSWRFRVRSVPKWMHSLPVNPKVYSTEHDNQKIGHKRSGCKLGIVYGFIFAFGCGALAALALLVLWALFANREAIIPAEYSSVRPVDFRYEKINVVVQSNVEDVKK